MSKNRLSVAIFLLFFIKSNAQVTMQKVKELIICKDSTSVDPWEEKIRSGLKDLREKGLDTSGLGLAFTNNFFYEVIFTHSNDKAILKKSIKWMGQVVKLSPCDQVNLDTYANLYYKLGNKKKAIAIEERAIRIENEKSIKEHRKPDNVFKETVDKMYNNQPTWPTAD